MLKNISLQNFRSYKKVSFNFSKKLTVIVGKNTAGKSNLVEAIYYLSHGKSFRAEKDQEVIKDGEEMAKAWADAGDVRLEAVFTNSPLRFSKKLLVNGIARRRADFIGNFLSVLFSPLDLDLITGSPYLRRTFLDDVLEQTDRAYRLAILGYEKALRQRNALLGLAKERGERNSEQFEYWDRILIDNGQILTAKRDAFVDFLNSFSKEILQMSVIYDKSVISENRLLQYREAEAGAGVTLVGPHRDDLIFNLSDNKNIKIFGSRGQQRLAVLQLKLLQLEFIEKVLGERPLLLLDDIFSELDSEHIDLVVSNIEKQQTIITTTHKEFLDGKKLKDGLLIELNDNRKI